ncbi:OmpA family protein [Myxococcota bacterium]|nr:OmpA family protein [Myxococcota bacterium]
MGVARVGLDRFVGIVLALGVIALASGCVTRTSYDALDERYDKLDREREALEAQVERLRLERQSLEAQYIEAQESYEDEREARDSLETNLQKIQREASRLDENLDAERLARMEAAAALAKREAELAKMQSSYDALVSDLEAEVSAGQIEIQRLREGLRLNVSDEVLFASGSAELDEKGRAVLVKVANQLKALRDTIQIRGHTDDRKIGGALAQRYPTNWELAAARAARVVRLLEEHGVDSKQLSAVSLGPNAPVAPNDSAENRARNRRIEILLIPNRAEGSPPEA